MPIGLQEMHPAVVHFPIAFLPLSLGADALGRLTGDYALLEMGRRTMPLAAAAAMNAAAFGLIAQQAVRAQGQAHDLLVTHRTLNAGWSPSPRRWRSGGCAGGGQAWVTWRSGWRRMG